MQILLLQAQAQVPTTHRYLHLLHLASKSRDGVIAIGVTRAGRFEGSS